MDVERRISKARTSLILKKPFFGSIALNLRFRESDEVPTIGTDGVSVIYNPKFVKTVSSEELVGLIAHEILHVVCMHPFRLKGRHLLKWNVAGDFVINLVLKEDGFILPKGGCFDKEFEGMNTDEVYNKLPPVTKVKCCKGLRPYSGGKDGDSEDIEGALSIAAQEAKVLIAQAAMVARQIGNLPEYLERLVGEVLEPKVKWQDKLRLFLERSTRNDYSWTRPNRRYLQQGFYLPSLYSQEIETLVVMIDTSGSISQDELTRFASELSEILTVLNIGTVHVLYVDTRVARVEEFTRDDLPLNLKAHGGGGTDFRPGFEWVDENGITPACLIYMTDLWCNSYPSTPDYPVLWVATDDGSEPPFGEVLSIKD